ncbi:MAG TPA: hypothetical protein VMG55_13090 [Stellaceae bacterium]|nr:hypothetical protein [Stellaceae bacterium]
MKTRILAAALGAAALVAAAIPAKANAADAAGNAIASWIFGLPAGGTAWGAESDHNFCISGWSLVQTPDGQIIWWSCRDFN